MFEPSMVVGSGPAIPGRSFARLRLSTGQTVLAHPWIKKIVDKEKN